MKKYISYSIGESRVKEKDSLEMDYNSMKGNIIDSMNIIYNWKQVTVFKLTNYPNEPIDGSYVAYKEKSLGVFYVKETYWKCFTLLRTNNDSINKFIDILLGCVLVDSKMSINPRLIDKINKAD